jgi:hypothetical protein
LALNFRLAVNMLQLIYALKSTTIDGFQRLPSPGFYLTRDTRIVFVQQAQINDLFFDVLSARLNPNWLIRQL